MSAASCRNPFPVCVYSEVEKWQTMELETSPPKAKQRVSGRSQIEMLVHWPGPASSGGVSAESKERTRIRMLTFCYITLQYTILYYVILHYFIQ